MQGLGVKIAGFWGSTVQSLVGEECRVCGVACRYERNAHQPPCCWAVESEPAGVGGCIRAKYHDGWLGLCVRQDCAQGQPPTASLYHKQHPRPQPSPAPPSPPPQNFVFWGSRVQGLGDQECRVSRGEDCRVCVVACRYKSNARQPPCCCGERACGCGWVHSCQSSRQVEGHPMLSPDVLESDMSDAHIRACPTTHHNPVAQKNTNAYSPACPPPHTCTPSQPPQVGTF